MVTDLINTKSNWIYQSNRLLESSYTLTVLEQKILRILASMIKKDDMDFKEYEFKAADLSKLMGFTNNKNIYRELDKLTDTLMTRVVKIKDKDNKNFEKYHFVEVAKYNGGVLKLKINPEMKPFYINLDWYTKYQLKNILQFKRTYSFRLYELLKQYENIGFRLISINELRTILDINKSQYPQYANLKQKVITEAIKEINKNTDLYINKNYEEFKENRKVTSIKFIIKSNKKGLDETAATSVKMDIHSIDPNIKEVKNIINSITGSDINDKLANEIYDCAAKHEKYGNKPLELIKEVIEYSKTQSIKGGFIGWFKATVSNYERPVKVVSADTFNNYEQRQYDFDSLEKKLLGWE